MHSDPKMKRALLSVASLAISSLFSAGYASQFKTYCGTTKQNMQLCNEKKGDVVLNGVQGYSHTYTLPSGQKFQWFYPNNFENTLCNYTNNFLKMPSGAWFPVNAECIEAGYTRFQLPSGNNVFYIYSD